MATDKWAILVPGTETEISACMKWLRTIDERSRALAADFLNFEVASRLDPVAQATYLRDIHVRIIRLMQELDVSRLHAVSPGLRAKFNRPYQKFCQCAVAFDREVCRLLNGGAPHPDTWHVLIVNPKGVLVYRDEAVGWVTSLNQYKGGSGSDRQFWLSAWSSTDFTINRKGKDPVRITRPFLSIVGNIPPDMLGELADKRGRENGSVDRILFAFPDPILVKWTYETPDPKSEKQFVEACLTIGRLPNAELKLNTLARAEFAAWYDEHNRSHDGPAGSWAKMDGYCARIANIIHHLRFAFGEIKSRDEVDVESVRRAIELIDYFKNHARRALGRMKAGRDGRVFARLLAFVLNAPAYRVRPRALIGAQITEPQDRFALL
jgi:hypothetical protein